MCGAAGSLAGPKTLRVRAGPMAHGRCGGVTQAADLDVGHWGVDKRQVTGL